MDLSNFIADVKDFPTPGILFRDITPLMQNGPAYHFAVNSMAEIGQYLNANMVVGPEARGFIFGCPVAFCLGVGFAPLRKKGKLPRQTIEQEYALEYGADALCLHTDAIKPGDRVLLVDDLLATGGTLLAAANLVEKLGGVVCGVVVLIELIELKGRNVLEDYPVFSLLQY